MNRRFLVNPFRLAFLAATLLFGFCLGCSSEPPPALEITEDMRKSIEAEDAAIDAAESANN